MREQVQGCERVGAGAERVRAGAGRVGVARVWFIKPTCGFKLNCRN